jgi:hypothetical protein
LTFLPYIFVQKINELNQKMWIFIVWWIISFY